LGTTKIKLPVRLTFHALDAKAYVNFVFFALFDVSLVLSSMI